MSVLACYRQLRLEVLSQLRRMGEHGRDAVTEASQGWERGIRSSNVFQHSHCGIAPVYANDAPAWVCARSAQVDARHRRARRQSIRPHVLRQTFPLEDMTPGEANLAFNIRRAHHLRVQHSIFHVGTEASKRATCELANLFAPLIPRATRKRVRNILGKDAHRMLPRRSHGCIMDA